ncbi:MAG: endonuclease/exonuclease/phosphatase family protein, partial [Bacteroidales bacterium]|nr:endonuclease/exonuclease/phosphatase family protein [Bacteroidales bacterium]
LAAVVILYVAGVLIYSSISAFKPDHKEDAEIINSEKPFTIIRDSLRLMTWNIGYAGLGEEMDFFYEGGRKVRPDSKLSIKYFNGIKFFIKDNNYIDFILLQEVDFDSKRSYGLNEFKNLSETLPEFAAIRAVNYKAAYVPVPWLNPMGRVESGLATFSRYQPREAVRLATPGNYSWPKSLYLLKRCILFTRYKVEGKGDLVLMNIHNSAFDDADKLREAEMGMIREIAVKEFENGNFVVIGGDWNQSPPGWDDRFEHGYVQQTVWPLPATYMPQGWHCAFDPSIPTNRDVTEPFDKTTTKTTILDYFVVSPNIEIMDVKTVDLQFEYSDHQPVLLNLILK